MVRWSWDNFQYRGVLLILIVDLGPAALAESPSGIVWTFFSCLSFLSSFSLSLVDGPISIDLNTVFKGR